MGLTCQRTPGVQCQAFPVQDFQMEGVVEEPQLRLVALVDLKTTSKMDPKPESIHRWHLQALGGRAVGQHQSTCLAPAMPARHPGAVSSPPVLQHPGRKTLPRSESPGRSGNAAAAESRRHSHPQPLLLYCKGAPAFFHASHWDVLDW